jgi:hypothetical protein
LEINPAFWEGAAIQAENYQDQSSKHSPAIESVRGKCDNWVISHVKSTLPMRRCTVRIRQHPEDGAGLRL